MTESRFNPQKSKAQQPRKNTFGRRFFSLIIISCNNLLSHHAYCGIETAVSPKMFSLLPPTRVRELLLCINRELYTFIYCDSLLGETSGGLNTWTWIWSLKTYPRNTVTFRASHLPYEFPCSQLDFALENMVQIFSNPDQMVLNVIDSMRTFTIFS